MIPIIVHTYKSTLSHSEVELSAFQVDARSTSYIRMLDHAPGYKNVDHFCLMLLETQWNINNHVRKWKDLFWGFNLIWAKMTIRMTKMKEFRYPDIVAIRFFEDNSKSKGFRANKHHNCTYKISPFGHVMLNFKHLPLSQLKLSITILRKREQHFRIFYRTKKCIPLTLFVSI